MFLVKERTALIGITALRTEARLMLKALKHSRIIITDRNAPRAVVLDYADYERMHDLIEMAEEGRDALEIERRRKKKTKRFLTHQQALKALA